MKFTRRAYVVALASAAVLLAAPNAFAQKKYGPGASDTEIKIGQTMPYSGPASAYAAIGKTEVAYFQMINDQGGINGRKINLISLDDGYSPPRAVEQVRRLVEEEQVLALFQTLGTPTNTAIHKYVNAKKVPHLFIATGATKWGDPKSHPWTMGWQPTYQTEANIYARYILAHKPNAKVAILYQNDDYGKDYLKGFKDGLGDKAASLIVAEVSYEVTDPTVDSQIVTLKASGADTFFNITTPKFAAQAIRKVHDMGWKPLHFLNNVSSSVGSTLTPAGLEKSAGIITAQYMKDAADPQWNKDPAMQRWREFMAKYMPGADLSDIMHVYGYAVAQLMVQVIKQCGDDLTRENLMKHAASVKSFEPDGLLPGIKNNTSPTDYYPIEQVQLQQFDGKRWVLFGSLMGHE
ncbi:MAG: branched-chain amino acid ABC transporter substrate-binding protein [Betaproteobacteria bacterium]|nr:branched-chain amino acid ABC transporter substrate-binding protein [Betaproteobacteria bacterium]